MTVEFTPWSSHNPPLPGWFNASIERDPNARRYWNGEAWSAPCYATDELKYWERARNTPSESPADAIKWRGQSLDSLLSTVGGMRTAIDALGDVDRPTKRAITSLLSAYRKTLRLERILGSDFDIRTTSVADRMRERAATA